MVWGTIVGGGFYALTGKVVGEAGMLTPWAFLAASVIALFSAFSFAELSARLPYSAGEARYVDEAFGKQWLAAAIGWVVIATGVLSPATLANAFAGFLQRFVAAPDWLIICLMVIGLGLVTCWGISEWAIVALLVTLVEIGGLAFILLAAGHHLQTAPARWRELVPAFSLSQCSGVFMGAYLAFYSFIGFEDMVNVAEEVKRPKRSLPIAILLSVVITGLLYFIVSLVTVLSAFMEELAASKSPLSLALGNWGAAGAVITVIGMLAGLNGALVQVVMSSRVAYGLARKQQAPARFASVNSWTRTPPEATIPITVVVLALALCFPLTSLVKATNTILLMVFAFVNLFLSKIKRDEAEPPDEGPNYPIWLPMVGFLVCAVFLVFHAAMMLEQAR
jgi:amino acid transporter